MAEYGSLPFKEQIKFFQSKVNLPTGSWTDIWEGMHSRAFVVAGAAKDDLLLDLRQAVDKAISQGGTLQQFRKDFYKIVDKHGWSYTGQATKGGRNWRTRTIFETNLRMSYSAGREAQMSDPDLRKRRPYGLYRLGNSAVHRKEHEQWDGWVVPLDDPWWNTHTPPNGWGCKCRKLMVSERDVQRMGLSVKKPPKDEPKVEVVGKKNPRKVMVVPGIDPGFAYTPGEKAWGGFPDPDPVLPPPGPGTQPSDWEPLRYPIKAGYNRPPVIPVDDLLVPLGPRAKNASEVIQATERALGGKSRIYHTPGGNVYVDADHLAQHIAKDPDRAQYLPLLEDLLEHPYEQWLGFQRHKTTGEVALRMRFIKLYKSKDGGLLFVANVQGGKFVDWTMFPRTASALNNQRWGKLLYGR